MDLQTVVTWLKAYYLIGLPLFVNILTSMLCTKADFTWFSKLKKPRFDIPFWAWGLFCNGSSVAVGYALHLLWTDANLWSKPAHLPALVFLAISLACNLSWCIVAMRMRKLFAATIVSVISVITGALAAFYVSNLNEAAGNCISFYAAFYGYASIVSYCMARDNKPRKINVSKKD